MEETGRENLKLNAAQNSNSTQGWYRPAGLWTATILSKAFHQQSPFHSTCIMTTNAISASKNSFSPIDMQEN
jgi:hypothetical protein